MLTAKYNRTVNFFGETTQWDFWGLWMGRAGNLPAAASSLWGTSPPDAEEGVGTASPPAFCAKGGYIKPSSPHCDPSCSANSSFVTTPRFPSGQRTPLKRAERTVQSVARGQLWGVWYPGASSAQVPWCSPVVVPALDSAAASLRCLSVTSGCAPCGVTSVSALCKYVTLVRNANVARSPVTGDGLRGGWEQEPRAAPFNLQCSWTPMGTWGKCLKWDY